MSEKSLKNWLKGRKYGKAGNTWKKGYNKGLREVSFRIERRGLENLEKWLEVTMSHISDDSNSEQGRLQALRDVCEYLSEVTES